MIVLGVNAFHGDSSAALVVDGEVVGAVEEERFRRVKHWAGFPSESIRWCLESQGISLKEVDHVAINQSPSAHWFEKLKFTLSNRPSVGFLLEKLLAKKERLALQDYLEEHFDAPFSGEVHHIEHHLAHLASAFYPSGFDEACVISVDGFGDFSSAAWGVGKGREIDIHNRVLFPHSLGIFYQAITQFLGFPQYGDEYKVMGMAPYGEPVYLKEMRELVGVKNGIYQLDLKFFRHHRESIAFEWKGGSPEFGNIYSEEISELFGSPRTREEELKQHHFDIARSAQALYEERFFEILDQLYEKFQCSNIALAGGCAMNSVANGKIYRSSRFERAYLQPAAGDAGGAVGAALTVWHKKRDSEKKPLIHAYLGPKFSNDQIKEVLDHNESALAEHACSIRLESDFQHICDTTVEAISEGRVIGWFQGAMEWGPRALGNRSILGDPRRRDMKDILNLKIKRRESFRPFAPSILREHVADWFEEDDDVPFMMKVFQIREEQRAKIPAVTHVDGSGRLQTVTSNSNDRYYQLISTFHKQTGVPILLNTSFNENEPIVCRPEEALACFLRTDMDLLVMGDWVVSRPVTPA